MHEIKYTGDCHRCGTSFSVTAMLGERADIRWFWHACPGCGVLSSAAYLYEGSRDIPIGRGIVAFDPQDDRQVRAVRAS